MTLSIPSQVAPSSPMIVHRSPWQSPVPYLFGGLAAMLCLISFALLILACSFSKQDGDEDNDTDGDRDLEAGDSKPDNHNQNLTPVFEEKYLVIMAGEAKPTFLATPISSSASSYICCNCRSNETEKSSTSSEVEMVEEKEKEKQESSDQVELRNTENQETAAQIP